MGYTAMQGGLSAIKAAEDLVRRRTLGRRRHALDPSEVAEKMSLGVDRVMSEGGLYDPAAAAVALVQAEGDLHEASFIVRAYRSTLPRIAYSIPTDTGEMRVLRRITPAFQFAPGGQLLGATRDYTQRLLDWRIAEPGSFAEDQAEPDACRAEPPVFTRIADLLRAEGLLPAPSESSPNQTTSPGARSSFRRAVPPSCKRSHVPKRARSPRSAIHRCEVTGRSPMAPSRSFGSV